MIILMGGLLLGFTAYWVVQIVDSQSSEISGNASHFNSLSKTGAVGLRASINEQNGHSCSERVSGTKPAAYCTGFYGNKAIQKEL